MLNIIARKPTSAVGDAEFIVVNRGAAHMHPFVSATATPQTLAQGEWFWGHYFKTREEALAHFNGRS